ncbi:hypothetical protein TorRG33x02_338500 [Trema orientale]|uniref:Uncharacterized protein n=1 Tax=Trema orientale TaxID=63057 RepID=A0A2P5AXP2_TREOI|nr:hypothetical protein TorRG33x02_338500 [Trema orientale]
MAEEDSDESSFKLRRWQRRNLIKSASSFVHGWSSSMVRGADWIAHRQWLRRGGKSTGLSFQGPSLSQFELHYSENPAFYFQFQFTKALPVAIQTLAVPPSPVQSRA